MTSTITKGIAAVVAVATSFALAPNVSAAPVIDSSRPAPVASTQASAEAPAAAPTGVPWAIPDESQMIEYVPGDPAPEGQTLIAGVVTDAVTGAPVEGVEVTALLGILWGPPYAVDTTDANGEYTLDVSLAEDFGYIPMSFDDPLSRYVVSTYDAAVQQGYVELVGVEMQQGTPITGTITDDSGNPLPGACVYWTSWDGYGVPFWIDGRGCADETGHYATIALPDGTYDANPYLFSNAYVAPPPQVVSVTFGEPATADFVFTSLGGGSITGTVYGPDGLPVGDAGVRILLGGTLDPATVVSTRSDGTFEAHVLTGVYDVMVTVGDSLTPGQPVLNGYVADVPTDGPPVDIVLTDVVERSVTVAGHVDLPPGLSATVQVGCDSGTPFAYAFDTVDPDGSYEFVVTPAPLYPCTWSASLSSDSSGELGQLSNSVWVDRRVMLDAATVNVDLAMPSTFTFDATDADGAPLDMQFAFVAVSGEVPFGDGTTGRFRSHADNYGTTPVSSLTLPTWNANLLYYSVYLGGGSSLSDEIPLAGQTSYTVVVETEPVTVSGNVGPEIDGWARRITVNCSGASASATPDASGDYTVDLRVFGGTSACMWMYSGSLEGGDGSFSMSTTVDLSAGAAVIDVPAATPFTVSTLDTQFQPVVIDTLFLSTSGSADVGGSSAWFSVSATAVGVSSVVIPTWNAWWLDYTAVYQSGNSVSGQTWIEGLSSYDIVEIETTTFTMAGVIGLPEGWSGSLAVSCDRGGESVPVGVDGSYAVTVVTTAGAACSVGVAATDGSGSNFSVFGQIIPDAEFIAFDLAEPTMYPVSVVNDAGDPLMVDLIDASISGMVGTFGPFSSRVNASGTSEALVPVWSPVSLYAYVETPNVAQSFAADIEGTTSYQIVVTPPPPPNTISGTVPLPEGWDGTVTVYCADGRYEVAPVIDGTYSVEASSVTSCNWSLSASALDGSGSIYMYRPIDPTLGDQTIDLALDTFTVAVADTNGAPVVAPTIDASLSGDVVFPDGAVGYSQSYGSGSETSSIELLTSGAPQLTAQATLADGTLVTVFLDVMGETEFVFVVEAEVDPYVLADGVFTNKIVAAPGVNSGKAGKSYSLTWTLAMADGTAVIDPSVVVSAEVWRVECAGFESLVDAPAAGTGEAAGAVTVSNKGEFELKWRSPRSAGCYVVGVALDTGQTLVAKFDLR